MIEIVPPEQLTMRRKQSKKIKEELHTVKQIVLDVRSRGDIAIREYTKKLDGVELEDFAVSKEEIHEAYEKVDEVFLTALEAAASRIRSFHTKQKRSSWVEPEVDGSIMGQLLRPLSSVAVYVPGGKASYPSSVLMNVIPAKVAGVPEIIMLTPPQRDGSIPAETLVAAKIAGVNRIYKAGGAQAIAGVAYGTTQLPKVDKIVGPGNIYVALAKQEVYGEVDIDSIAGPSEIVVIADERANPKFIAADLLAQAEHDGMASAILLTPSIPLAEKVIKQLSIQIESLERKEIAAQALQRNGAICITQNLDQAFQVSNELAPEHLELLIQDPWQKLGQIHHAGAIFLGEYSPEAIGDYFAGPNHVIPTNGTARFFSPLNVDHFIKKMSVISYSKQALYRDSQQVITLANTEGLGGHAASISIRLQDGEERE